MRSNKTFIWPEEPSSKENQPPLLLIAANLITGSQVTQSSRNLNADGSDSNQLLHSYDAGYIIFPSTHNQLFL